MISISGRERMFCSILSAQSCGTSISSSIQSWCVHSSASASSRHSCLACGSRLACIRHIRAKGTPKAVRWCRSIIHDSGGLVYIGLLEQMDIASFTWPSAGGDFRVCIGSMLFYLPVARVLPVFFHLFFVFTPCPGIIHNLLMLIIFSAQIILG